MSDLPPIAKGQARAFRRCPTHGTPAWHDYVPYSFSTAIGVMPCGCDPKGASVITEAEFHAASQATDLAARITQLEADRAEAISFLDEAEALIQEAKGTEGPSGGFVTDHLDFAETWLGKLRATLSRIGEDGK